MKNSWEYSKDKKKITITDKNLYVNSQEEISVKKDDIRHVERNNESITELIKIKKNIKSILDVGCRECLAYNICKNLGIFYIGADISQKSVDFAKKQGRNAILADMHCLSNYINEKFDAILSIHSLEHCYDIDKVLNELKKCLNDNGFLVVRVPIQKDIFSQSLISGKDGKKIPTHYCVFTPSSLDNIMKNNGFDKRFSKSFNIGKKYEEYLYIGCLK